MKSMFAGLVLAAAMFVGANASAQEPMHKPTIVLVHGAFADASSWNGVVKILQKDGYFVIAAANPLRGAKSDGANIGSLVADLKDPVVLVGHSYGGNVITEAANGHSNVKALVYVSAFAPDTGETVAELAGKFPGSTLGQALAPPAELADGSKDLYILQNKFPAQFAADVPAAQAALMAATQRPLAQAALDEKAGDASWKTIPSWFIYGDADKNIPPQTMAFMARRANAKGVVVVKGASHVVMVSHPEAVAKLIEKAASAQ
ncbi:alpha/beta fold hydrolase [Dyella nitratireducens]|uniref:Alpha/beta hydrolase n=1 Tax=Dyella nitratireducens TaxID=1849580 RepID=A0ABQ1G9P7_9GAMM|nr:alpha/beta hydrolase [Dyella nitratireducens]GGA39478.1 alpha/beta hydrolase [Dyella nitratireducens]GLQ40445.1 alpha/beta hydrolase [Dyella nitratireducens]